MASSTWKGFERRLAQSYGRQRAQGSHGPDFYIDIQDLTLRAEAKKRSASAGFKTIMDWLTDRDILFVGLKGRRDKDALVVMSKAVFDEIWRRVNDH